MSRRPRSSWSRWPYCWPLTITALMRMRGRGGPREGGGGGGGGGGVGGGGGGEGGGGVGGDVGGGVGGDVGGEGGDVGGEGGGGITLRSTRQRRCLRRVWVLKRWAPSV